MEVQRSFLHPPEHLLGSQATFPPLFQWRKQTSDTQTRKWAMMVLGEKEDGTERLVQAEVTLLQTRKMPPDA